MAAAGAHRYWRIYVNSGYNSTWLNVYEVELRVEVGGADVTTSSTPVTASSTYQGYPTSNVVDGSTDTTWYNSGSTSSNQWLSFDLGAAKAIAEVAVYANYSRPKDVIIQYSDNGSTYTNATGVITLVNTSAWQTIAVEQAPPDPNAPQKTTPTLSVTTAVGWTNSGNVLASDNSRASMVVTVTSSNIITLGWTDSLPADAILLGCILKVEGYASTTSSTPQIRNCYFTAGATTGDIPSLQNLSTTETLYTFGGANTLPSGFTSASRPTSVTVRTYQATTTSTTHYIDYIGVELWWKLPGDWVNVLFIGEMF